MSGFEQKHRAHPSSNETRAPAPLARPEIHTTVAQILDPLPRGRLLDVPAGEGALSARLREAGFSDRDIWDISAVAAFFNMSNRVASATDMRPNTLYHAQAR